MPDVAVEAAVGLDEAGLDEAGLEEAGLEEAGADDAGLDEAGADEADVVAAVDVGDGLTVVELVEPDGAVVDTDAVGVPRLALPGLPAAAAGRADSEPTRAARVTKPAAHGMATRRTDRVIAGTTFRVADGNVPRGVLRHR